MTPEKLKELAEALGRSVAYIKNNHVFINNDMGHPCMFDPKTGYKEREEVLLWLGKRGIVEVMGVSTGWYVTYNSIDFFAKDYTTALMMACEKELSNE